MHVASPLHKQCSPIVFPNHNHKKRGPILWAHPLGPSYSSLWILGTSLTEGPSFSHYSAPPSPGMTLLQTPSPWASVVSRVGTTPSCTSPEGAVHNRHRHQGDCHRAAAPPRGAASKGSTSIGHSEWRRVVSGVHQMISAAGTTHSPGRSRGNSHPPHTPPTW